MRLRSTLLPVLGLVALAGCATQLLSDDRAKSSIAGTLGVAPQDVTIVSRAADGPTNTNFVVEAAGIGGRRVCTINGGNIMTMGMTNGRIATGQASPDVDGPGNAEAQTATAAGAPATPVGAIQEDPVRVRRSIGPDATLWFLAALPALRAALAGPAAASGLPSGLVWAVGVGASAALVVLDQRTLLATGACSRARLPAVAWLLLPPAYLWRRAKITGRSWPAVWASVAAVVLSPVIAVASLGMAVSLAGADGLPACADRGKAADVLATFDDIPQVKAARIRGLSLLNQRQTVPDTAAEPNTRACRGTVVANDTEEYDIDYGFDMRDGSLLFHVRLP